MRQRSELAAKATSVKAVMTTIIEYFLEGIGAVVCGSLEWGGAVAAAWCREQYSRLDAQRKEGQKAPTDGSAGAFIVLFCASFLPTTYFFCQGRASLRTALRMLPSQMGQNQFVSLPAGR